MLITADCLLAYAAGWLGLLAGVILWGVHMGMTQGLLAAMVADAFHPDLRGTAFGLFNLASGAAMLIGSVIAGWAWDRFGATATFWTGAAFAAACLLMLTAKSPAPAAPTSKSR
jgi:MFS family permease